MGHYLNEKERDKTISGMLVLPEWKSETAWWGKVKHMQTVRRHKEDEHLFTAPDGGKRRNLGPTRWPVVVLWDPTLEETTASDTRDVPYRRPACYSIFNPFRFIKPRRLTPRCARIALFGEPKDGH